ncbi:hypothetical protein K1T71_008512 [Dendrolimus kikuchii]|uniref:Uncharacterized protein n=1 Tax=Dendrolimus kikuchii TaxID=765133 RepID=A0ACC1CYB7_9NEOP|nr:hypothetical protein K1T71_008512 [Dendrolimus kikuchii]
MKFFVQIIAVALLVAVASAGYIRSGWSSPQYSSYTPVSYSGGYGGYSGYSGYGGHSGHGYSGYGGHGGLGGYGGWGGHGYRKSYGGW